MSNELTAAEVRTLRAMRTPDGVQRFLDEDIVYNKELDGVARCRSPRMVLRDKTGHCMEGGLLAAAALRVLGYPPLLVDLEAVRDDDHVLAVFQRNGCWGAVAQSNYSGLRFREPVYRTVRELVMSYFEHYYNLDREKTLRGYSRPVRLEQFDARGWMTSEEDPWYIPELLCAVQHYPVLKPVMVRQLSRVDYRLSEAGKYRPPL